MIDLFTSFAPDRAWSFPIWRQAVSNCGFPISKLVLCDNTDQTTSHEIIGAVPPGFTLSSVVLNRYPIRFDKEPGNIRSEHFANIWNLHIPKFDQEFVLSLEDDVLPEPGFVKQLVECMKPDVGVAGLGVKCRHKSAHLMVYHCTSLEPFVIDRRNLVKERRGIVEVDSVSTSCCLFRRSLLDDGFRFLSSPNGDGKGGWGHEWSLMKKCRLAGLKVVCNFDVPVRHWKNASEWI